MANQTIDQLTVANALGGTEVVHVMQGGNSRQTSAQALANYIVALVTDGSPGTMDTLNEIAAALGDDPNFVTTITNLIAGKVANARLVNTGAGLTGGGDLSADRTLAADLATAAEIHAATANKLLDTASIYQAMQPVELTDAADIAWDMNLGVAFYITLAGTRSLLNPTNVITGKSGLLRVIQDATGGRGFSLPSNINMAESAAIEFSTAANAKDTWGFYCWSPADIELYPSGKAFG